MFSVSQRKISMKFEKSTSENQPDEKSSEEPTLDLNQNSTFFSRSISSKKVLDVPKLFAIGEEGDCEKEVQEKTEENNKDQSQISNAKCPQPSSNNDQTLETQRQNFIVASSIKVFFPFYHLLLMIKNVVLSHFRSNSVPASLPGVNSTNCTKEKEQTGIQADELPESIEWFDDEFQEINVNSLFDSNWDWNPLKSLLKRYSTCENILHPINYNKRRSFFRRRSTVLSNLKSNSPVKFSKKGNANTFR